MHIYTVRACATPCSEKRLVICGKYQRVSHSPCGESLTGIPRPGIISVLHIKQSMNSFQSPQRGRIGVSESASPSPVVRATRTARAPSETLGTIGVGYGPRRGRGRGGRGPSPMAPPDIASRAALRKSQEKLKDNLAAMQAARQAGVISQDRHRRMLAAHAAQAQPQIGPGMDTLEQYPTIEASKGPTADYLQRQKVAEETKKALAQSEALRKKQQEETGKYAASAAKLHDIGKDLERQLGAQQEAGGIAQSELIHADYTSDQLRRQILRHQRELERLARKKLAQKSLLEVSVPVGVRIDPVPPVPKPLTVSEPVGVDIPPVPRPLSVSSPTGQSNRFPHPRGPR